MGRRLRTKCGIGRFLPLITASMLAALTMACATPHDPLSPIEGVASEALQAVASTRLAVANESLNSVQVIPARRVILIDRVRTPALCAPLIDAIARRATAAIDVIVTLSANPLADCVPLDGYVSTYRVTVPDVSPGIVTVRLFERVGDTDPELRAQERVTIRP